MSECNFDFALYIYIALSLYIYRGICSLKDDKMIPAFLFNENKPNINK